MFMGNIKIKFVDFLNESSNLDSNNLLDNVELLKNTFSDYREVLDFFKHIEGEFYGKDNPVVGIGFTSGSFGVPLFRDISDNLVKSGFKISLKDLSKKYKTSYYDSNISDFINWNKSCDKKYYYYTTPKVYRLWYDEKYSGEEKEDFIRDYFSGHSLSDRYDISINSPVDYIDINLVEK